MSKIWSEYKKYLNKMLLTNPNNIIILGERLSQKKNFIKPDKIHLILFFSNKINLAAL